MPTPIIAIHGGAGVLSRKTMTSEKEKAYVEALKLAVNTGSEILGNGGSACDAIEAAIVILEDNPLFNAGKGSVFTNKGNHEMDASFMDGSTLEAGAVSKISSIRNPVKLARVVMNKAEAVLLSGREALDFAEIHELQFEDEDYFFDQYRYDQWMLAKKTGVIFNDEYYELDLDNGSTNGNGYTIDDDDNSEDQKFGTVGAVALDSNGNLAAATSTGGLTNKRFGRVGDSSIIGAGTYANNETCAVSCTGYGESFIRSVAAYDVSALMQYAKKSIVDACEAVIHDKIGKQGGLGGMIALDKKGNVKFTFNTVGMYRAFQSVGGEELIEIYK